jgi:hypothetical protein
MKQKLSVITAFFIVGAFLFVCTSSAIPPMPSSSYTGTGVANITTTNVISTTANVTNLNVSNANITVSDYVWIPVDAGIDSIISAPSSAARVQGILGSPITLTPANVSYSTFTTSGANVTEAVWGSGTQTATFTATVEVGKEYRLQFTPTVTGQVPTYTITSGASYYTIPTVESGTVENIYFRASTKSVVFTVTSTDTSTWSTASTTLYKYSQPVTSRAFAATPQSQLAFYYKFPSDWNAGTITATPYFVVTNATAPANTETIKFNFRGLCYATSISDLALGTAIGSTTTADATYTQYDTIVGTETAAITLTGAAAGSICVIDVGRNTSDTYDYEIGLTGILLKFTRVIH